MIYSFTNQKGGVGKTTLALNFAGELAAQGRKVLFVDADPQSSALDWSHQRTEELPFAMVALPKPVVHREVAKLKENFDDIVIDPPPRTNEQSKSVVMASDLCVIPVQPSPYDIWAAQEILQLIKEAQIYKPEIKVVFVINRRINNTAIAKDAREALTAHETPVLESAISQRVAFAESAAAGLLVREHAAGSPADQEMKALANEIIGIFQPAHS